MKKRKKIVDCRRCAFFVPFEKMNNLERRVAYETMIRRKKKVVLGYCRRFNRGVTYYFGSCYGFQPKNSPERLRKLIEFLKYT